MLFGRRGAEGEAREILKTGLDRLPNSAALWGMMGASWGRAGDLERALSSYERSVALRPTPLGCKTLAALVFEVRKDKTRAVALWKQALALDPNQADVREFLRRHVSRLPRILVSIERRASNQKVNRTVRSDGPE